MKNISYSFICTHVRTHTYVLVNNLFIDIKIIIKLYLEYFLIAQCTFHNIMYNMFYITIHKDFMTSV